MVRERACEVRQKSIESAKPVISHGVHDALEVPVPIPVEAHFLGFLLIGQGLQGACAVEAAVGTVGGAGESIHAPAPRGTGCLVPLVKMSKVWLHDGLAGMEFENDVMWWGTVLESLEK